MKIFKLLAVAFVAMLSFSSCTKDCEHDFIEYDYSEALIGTWTIIEEGQAEAMVINPDGSFEVTGVMQGGSLYESKGTIKVVNNKVSLVFEGDKDVTEGRLELVSGKSLSIVINEEYDIRLTYDYCKNDLSDEIIGMWVCTEEVFDQEEESVAINTFTEDGKSYLTAYMSEVNGYLNQLESNYKVVGNLLIGWVNDESGMPASYQAFGLNIIPNGTELGDMMTVYNPVYGTKPTFLRVKQSLDLTGTYDYNTAYVSNLKGTDEDFTILGHTFNMSNIKGSNFDMLFRSDLFCVDLTANSIKQHFRTNGRDVEITTPITVDGNKVTIDFSAVVPALRKVDMYMFQDAAASQLHMYMHTEAFINYFANLEIVTMLQGGTIDPTDADAVEKVFTDMKKRVQSINVSFVLKARK